MRALARRAGRLLTGLGVLALSPVSGLAALAGMATFGAAPDVFAVTGLAVFGAVFFLGLLLCLPRPGPLWGRWLRAVVVLAVEVAVVWQVSAATLRVPPGGPAPKPVAGQREWRLATGSRLAYVRLAPKRVTRPDPVVFLSGGPGVSDLAGDARFFAGLTADGYEVFVYDRLGAGRSERLADPRGYGLPRDVADLEAARQAMGARRLILIGQDHGAQLAAAYLAEHPSQVTRTVLAAPAALDGPRAASPGLSLATPTRGLPSPRLLAVYTLLRANPQAAHAFAGDRELEAADVRGYATLAPRTTLADLPEGLSTATAPALIVRGLRQDWSQLAAYRTALPRAELVSLPDGSYRGKPYLQLLRAFLAGKPLPVNGGDAPRG